jgi:hypothetical protein
MKKYSKYLIFALTLGFFLMGFNAYQEAKPTPKAPIYKKIRNYSPYYLEKTFGGLEILSKNDSKFKEKPNNMEIFHELEALEKKWGKNHLKIKNNNLIILDNNKTILKKLPIKNQIDKNFIHKFYGI